MVATCTAARRRLRPVPARSIWLFSAGLAACAPPSLRNAHSLDKGEVAFELAGAYDATSIDAEIYTVEDDQMVGSTGATDFHGDAVFRVGTGRGFELGVSTIGAHLKYSVLDERRHPNAPLSIALTAEGGYRYGGTGLLFSKQLGTGPVKLRPVANLLLQSHSSDHYWDLPEVSVAYNPELDVVNPGDPGEGSETDFSEPGRLHATVDISEVAIPVGIEVPIAISDDWDIVPFTAYAMSIPTEVSYRNLSCDSCLAGLGNMLLQRRSIVWVGVKFQPGLKRPSESSTTTTPPSTATETQP